MIDLLELPLLGRLLRWKHARSLLQIPMLLVAAVMVWDGLTGSQLAARNLATVITWVIYRGLLVLALLVAGNLFCMACPFMLPRNLARRFVRPLRHWPRRLRNKWVAAALLGLFLFGYEYFSLWSSPWWTAWLILAYFGAALLIDSLFRGAPFCKYVCPLGQFNFVGSLVSPLEVRVRAPETCAACATKDCIKGHAGQRGCELWLFQPRKVGNLDCTFCLDCVHACPHDNVGLVARLPGADVWAGGARSGLGDLARRPDMAVLALVFTFGALLNAFNMVSPVYALEQWLAGALGSSARLPVLGTLFALGLVVEPAALLGVAALASRALGGGREPLARLVVRYAYGLAPLGFGIWLAHYMFHFATGFWTLVPVAQLVLGSVGLPTFGPPRWDLGALLAGFRPLPLQYGLIGLGLLVTLTALLRIARRDTPARPGRAALPWLALALLLAAAALWVMSLPMEMRGIA